MCPEWHGIKTQCSPQNRESTDLMEICRHRHWGGEAVEGCTYVTYYKAGKQAGNPTAGQQDNMLYMDAKDETMSRDYLSSRS